MKDIKELDENIDHVKVNRILNKVCDSEIMVKSPRNIRLLRFLASKALSGDFVKEHVIGSELFGRWYDSSKNDGKVRVYMYNLRKKLDLYYQEEGVYDEIRFVINKGQYNLEFQNIDRSGDDNNLKRRKLIKLVGVLSLSLILGIGSYFLLNKSDDDCWSPFFSKDSKNLCVVSDHFLLSSRQFDGEYTYIRKDFVNNENDLAKYLRKNPTSDYAAVPFTFLTKMAPFTTHSLSKWFFSNNSDFRVLLESEFSLEDLKSNNVIFAGQFKTLRESKKLFLRDTKVFFHNYRNIEIKSGETKGIYRSYADGDKTVDYAIVSFMLVDNNHSALFFASNHDVGTLATIQRFTDKKWLKEFYKDRPEGVRYFNAMFEVNGVGRTELTCELIELEWIY